MHASVCVHVCVCVCAYVYIHVCVLSVRRLYTRARVWYKNLLYAYDLRFCVYYLLGRSHLILYLPPTLLNDMLWVYIGQCREVQIPHSIALNWLGFDQSANTSTYM